MKKIIAMLMAAMLIAAMAVTAMASGASIAVDTVKQEAKIGDEVSVSVSLNNNPGIAGISFSIEYDKTRLELVGYENSGINGWTVIAENGGASWAEASNYTGNGEVLKLKFKVIDNAPSGFAEIKLTEVKAGNLDEERVEFVAVSGGITVKGICKHVNTEVRNEKAATCAAEGYTGDTYCKDCNELVKKGGSLPKNAQNHVGGTEIKGAKKANCVEEGYTGDTYCKGCGVKLSDGEKIAVDPNSHKETEVINKKEATCKDAGYTGDTYCKACDTIFAKGTEIAKNENHKFGAWKVTKEATKSEEGLKERVCSVCDKIETAKIAKLKDDAAPIHISANGESKGEQNPNTGAEPIIGLAVLAAVCTGAYIVGKKRH